ncbi:hypothetical protein AT01_699 [Yersinia aldovae 670-83]|nr:hypothetical protein AT01_699 [Yersinia aldovae 670-83]
MSIRIRKRQPLHGEDNYWPMVKILLDARINKNQTKAYQIHLIKPVKNVI